MPGLPTLSLRRACQIKSSSASRRTGPKEGRIGRSLAGGVVDVNKVAFGGPVVEPMGIANRKIDAAVTLRVPEAVVPIGAVESTTFVKIHGPGHIFEVIKIILDAVTHRFCFEFSLNMKKAWARPETIHASRSQGSKDKMVVIVDGEGLFKQVDADPATSCDPFGSDSGGVNAGDLARIDPFTRTDQIPGKVINFLGGVDLDYIKAVTGDASIRSIYAGGGAGFNFSQDPAKGIAGSRAEDQPLEGRVIAAQATTLGKHPIARTERVIIILASLHRIIYIRNV